VLPAAARLTKSQEFRLVVRRGRRAGRARLVVHLLPPESAARAGIGAGRSASEPQDTARASAADGSAEQHPAQADSSADSTASPSGADTGPTRETGPPARVGFVVSKAVGNAVVRHRVTRRLRHLARDRLSALPAGTLVVVRALPAAATASSRDLGADLDAALRKLRKPRGGGPAANPR